jgi:hypothetical protein
MLLEGNLERKNVVVGFYLPAFASLMVAAAALFVWITLVPQVNPLAMNDLGLVSVMPPAMGISLGLLTVGFCLTLYQNPIRTPLVILYIAILIFMLYGVATLAEGTVRTQIEWKLMGIMDYVHTEQSVDPLIDAFHNWPGFFILMAFLTRIAGLEDPTIFALWAPVFLNLLYLGPLLMLLRTVANDQRLIWLTIWLFYLSNWIGQDYLSPQGFAYFFYLTILAILLQWFQVPNMRFTLPAVISRFAGPLKGLVKRTDNWMSATQLLRPVAGRAQMGGLMLLIIILFLTLVPTHQLSPFAIIATTGILVIFNRIKPHGLPVLMAVATAAWVSYMATAYFGGHAEEVASAIGAIGSNVNDNLTNRLRGSPEHIFIIYLRIGMTLFLWGIALAGWLRRSRGGLRDVNFTLLAVVPFTLLGLQTYGGEMLLRVYFFSLPFMAFFAATAFFPTASSGRTWRTTGAIALFSLLLMASFLFTRYGNERMDYFAPEEIEAVEHLYSIAEPGSQLLAGTGTLPWRYQDYNNYRYVIVQRHVRTNSLERIVNIMQDQTYPGAYLILTRSQKASAELFIGWEPGTWERFEESIFASDQFRLIYANEHAAIFVLRESDPRRQETAASGLGVLAQENSGN